MATHNSNGYGTVDDLLKESENRGITYDSNNNKEENRNIGYLTLEDNEIIEGISFGYNGSSVAGEVVFNTGMVGYPESLTDPSYKGQILVLTYPLIGNYGVPSETEYDEFGLLKYFESNNIQITALIISDYSYDHSHYAANLSLSQWLNKHKIAGLCNIDTRKLTKKLRMKGSMLGKIEFGNDYINKPINFYDPNEENLVGQVSRKLIWEYGAPKQGSNKKKAKIIAIDCGMKNNIIRYLCEKSKQLAMKNKNNNNTNTEQNNNNRECKDNNDRKDTTEHKMGDSNNDNDDDDDDTGIHLKVVPWDFDLMSEKDINGLFLSNGPGNPEKCDKLIKNLSNWMKYYPNSSNIPLFGICLGNQILALSAGASTFKMKFGNRGMNQPVVDLRTCRCYITPQNHGFAVDEKSLSLGWKPLFRNCNDDSNEGIIHAYKPWFSVQFHPEHRGGPTDGEFLFDLFLNRIQLKNRYEVTIVDMPSMYNNIQQKRVHKVLLVGSGGLSIGQAGEFDYSGSQAIKALKEENVKVILINPNIATVQTSEGMADEVYFLPITLEYVAKVIDKERPDGILLQFGGQTALNCGIQLKKQGILERYNVQVLGTPIETIEVTEDREAFAQALKKVNEKVAPSMTATSVKASLAAAKAIGYPVLLRSAFALGGAGSGFANNEEELTALASKALSNCEQVIIDKSLKGWKEVEYEVVRDSNDNCITVCNMENFDPLGIHTGDSIVVAPSQTLSNHEYYMLRSAAIKIVRSLGVIGECNIQYALDPFSNDYCVIEVNARLSRSSALASKATGYPLAYVAAKLAMGKELRQIENSITQATQACFEPSLDYCVVKIPRWDLKKFNLISFKIGSAMKSVGEVMAIDRKFEAAFSKALRMVNDHCDGFGYVPSRMKQISNDEMEKELQQPSDIRVFAIALAFLRGYSVNQLYDLTKIDKWFLCKLRNIMVLEKKLELYNNSIMNELKLNNLSFENNSHNSHLEILNVLKKYVPKKLIKKCKESGFSDLQISRVLLKLNNEWIIRALRKSYNITPFVKQIDTLAAEFPAMTNYLYVTYNGNEHDLEFDEHGIMVLGCGAYRIGSSCEFDWCAVSAVRCLKQISDQLGHQIDETNTINQRELKKAQRYSSSNNRKQSRHSGMSGMNDEANKSGFMNKQEMGKMRKVKSKKQISSIVVNYNPETVSTDFDECDRLYFEELSFERVLDIYEIERSKGIILSVGGQIPNNLAMPLYKCGVRILGTQPDSIDRCENRHLFSKLLDELQIDQPKWIETKDYHTGLKFASKVGYPVLIRPSYVLSGAAMHIVNDSKELENYLKQAANVSRNNPVVISKFITNAKEIEMDAVANNGIILNYAISEHVENAGVHSGDATLILPAQNLYVETTKRIKKITNQIAYALNITGPFNIQFLSKDNDIKVIECNLRASRSFPFVSKTFNVNFIDLATRAMVQQMLEYDYTTKQARLMQKSIIHRYKQEHHDRLISPDSDDNDEKFAFKSPRSPSHNDNNHDMIDNNNNNDETDNNENGWRSTRVTRKPMMVSHGYGAKPLIDARQINFNLFDMDYVAVKSPMFSFTRLQGADPVLGVEMASTGEVACFGDNKHEAFLKALISSGYKLPIPNPMNSNARDRLRLDYIYFDAMPTNATIGTELFDVLATQSGTLTPHGTIGELLQQQQQQTVGNTVVTTSGKNRHKDNEPEIVEMSDENDSDNDNNTTNNDNSNTESTGVIVNKPEITPQSETPQKQQQQQGGVDSRSVTKSKSKSKATDKKTGVNCETPPPTSQNATSEMDSHNNNNNNNSNVNHFSASPPIDDILYESFNWQGAKFRPNILVSVGSYSHKYDFLDSAQLLTTMGFSLYATDNTHEFLKENDIESIQVSKPSMKDVIEKDSNGNNKPNVLDLLGNGDIHMVINVSGKQNRQEKSDGYHIRRKATDYNVPLITNMQLAKMCVRSLAKKYLKSYEYHFDVQFMHIKSWKEYMSSAHRV